MNSVFTLFSMIADRQLRPEHDLRSCYHFILTSGNGHFITFVGLLSMLLVNKLKLEN